MIAHISRKCKHFSQHLQRNFRAAGEAFARPMYERFVAALAAASGRPVRTGEFGADMAVELVNDGPVTIWIDSKNKE